MTVTPYLIVDGASGAIDWYREVFGAVEVMRWTGGAGRLPLGTFRRLIDAARLQPHPSRGGCAAR